MTSEERASASNGIWLCDVHARAIDAKDSEFSVELLQEWKRRTDEASWKSVIEGIPFGVEVLIPTLGELGSLLHVATSADLDIFRRTPKWPATTVMLTLKVDHVDETLSTRALAKAVIKLDDLILVAPPGMGKTTTLFQIAEGILDCNGGTPIIVPLGDWATENETILNSILKRIAFRDISESDLRSVASKPGVVLLLDGWNELDVAARARARSQVATLKAELPELSFVISTRKQATDVPFTGTRVDLLPLSEEQQIEIAIAIRGNAGKKLVDQAWRTAGVRELVTIPLYLTTLLALPENTPFPTTKEEVLRHFVTAHENKANRAEEFFAVTQGFQQDYLNELAVVSTSIVNTAIVDNNARKSISQTATLLANDGQISTKPQPNAVLDVLVSNHLLMRSGEMLGYSFQHQQFQEWYASHSVERRIMTEVADVKTREVLKAEVLNLPVWEEAILFSVERLARGDTHQRAECGKAILAAFEVDPILAAEMIFRSTEDVWAHIAVTIQELVAHWHTPGKVDRAVRFMLTSGRSEFLDAVWPLITDENEQNSLEALRNCRRFRPSILGKQAENKIKDLPKHARTVLLSEIASHSDMDGLDLASTIAMNDPEPEVQASVIEAFMFRRADYHVAKVLQKAGDETFDLIVRRCLVDEVDDERVKKSVEAARKRQAAEEETSTYEQLRMIVYAKEGENFSSEIAEIISMIEIDHQSVVKPLIEQAYNLYPDAVADGLLARVKAGSTLFYGADDILYSAGLVLEDDALLQLVLAGPASRDDLAEAAASVLGPMAVGNVVDACLNVETCLRLADGKYDSDTSDIYRGLKRRLAHVPGSSLVASVVARSALADNGQMGSLADLLSDHSNDDNYCGRPFDAASLTVIQNLVEVWGNRMLASGKATRRQLASIARLVSRVPSVSLLPILKRLLDEELHRYRDFHEQARTAGWRPSDAVNEARNPLTHVYQQAFLAIKTPETAVMIKEYLTDEYFGVLSARILADQWQTANEPPRNKFSLGRVDFSGVKEKHAACTANPYATSVEAEAIFEAIELLIVDSASKEHKWLAVALAISALRLPHGERDCTIQKLISIAPRSGHDCSRSELLLSLVLSGKEIDIDLIGDGIAETFEAAETKSWILMHSEGYELKIWLRLLPFVNRPVEALAIVRGMPPEQREPQFLQEMIDGIGYAPTVAAEELLFKLAEEDTRFYLNHRWRGVALRLGTLSSAQRILNLTINGAFDGEATNDWHFLRELGGLISAHPDLRAHVYGKLKEGGPTATLILLARAVAESPDEDGILLLVNLELSLKHSFLSYRAIKEVITKHIPSESWKGAYNIVPNPAIELRRKLFAMTSDGCGTDAPARWLNIIDEIRDEYGTPETEPRHPDLTSGKAWPISNINSYM
ncbi:NACHT domain-containing protein [Shewanella psychrotolerans]|uniref:NACHT domain-containing protein n=1 Tax=Shewanella psychrotolerans TaxID=2864206 RepID=UPI001C656390|nr:hypothetical protein [Shewanella psychrotolerans]QYK03144.1 hypothetical protein K0I62_09590 [Shewanella psychrotolerans]